MDTTKLLLSGLTERLMGGRRGHTELYRGAEYAINFLLKILIEVAVNDDVLDHVMSVIVKAAYTGRFCCGDHRTRRDLCRLTAP